MEIAAGAAAVATWKKIKGTHWKWFAFYCFFIIASELTGRYFNDTGRYAATYVFYNYFEIPAEFLFFFWLYFMAFQNTKYRLLPVFCAGSYLACWVADRIYFSKLHVFFYSFSYTVGNLLLLILVLCFFIQLVTSDAILTFRTNMLFWISVGLLIYYLGSCPYYGMRNTMATSYRRLYISYTCVVYILDCLMYLMFTFSFIWGKPRSPYSL